MPSESEGQRVTREGGNELTQKSVFPVGSLKTGFHTQGKAVRARGLGRRDQTSVTGSWSQGVQGLETGSSGPGFKHSLNN